MRRPYYMLKYRLFLVCYLLFLYFPLIFCFGSLSVRFCRGLRYGLSYCIVPDGYFWPFLVSLATIPNESLDDTAALKVITKLTNRSLYRRG